MSDVRKARPNEQPTLDVRIGVGVKSVSPVSPSNLAAPFGPGPDKGEPARTVAVSVVLTGLRGARRVEGRHLGDGWLRPLAQSEVNSGLR
jgi:hypothetical protein